MKLYSKIITLLCFVIISGYAYPENISAEVVSDNDGIENDAVFQEDKLFRFMLDIKANGQDGPLEITPNDPLLISASLTPGLLEGTRANLWFAAYIYSLDEWYSYVWPNGWGYGLFPMCQEQLYSFTDMPFLYTTLPVGNYVFAFAAETISDPISFYYDWVGISVVDIPSTNDIISDPLTNGQTIGRQFGGTFVDNGWKHTSDNNKIVYEFPPMTSGYVSFDITNMSTSSRGGMDIYDYYFGIYDDATGDKKDDYTGCAFIEVRSNYETSHPLLKLQSGAGTTPHEISEVYNAAGSFSPKASNIYHHEIIFGNGKAMLYIDGNLMITSTYKGTINWNHIFVGDTNYKGTSSGYTGMSGYTFSNIVLKTSK